MMTFLSSTQQRSDIKAYLPLNGSVWKNTVLKKMKEENEVLKLYIIYELCRFPSRYVLKYA